MVKCRLLTPRLLLETPLESCPRKAGLVHEQVIADSCVGNGLNAEVICVVQHDNFLTVIL